MANIFCMQQEVNFAMDWDCHFASDDIVAGVHIVRGIEAEEVLVAFVDFVGMQGAEFAVGAGITEVEGKLSSLGLDLHGVGYSGAEVDLRPSLLAKRAERYYFGAYEYESGNDKTFGAPRKALNLGVRRGRFPNEERQQKLSQQKRNSHLDHGVVQLFVNQVPVGGNVHWRRPRVPHDGHCGRDR